MKIGIPKEIMQYEKRIALIPSLARKLVDDGHKVLVERDAGEGSFNSDKDYEKAGCIIVKKAPELYCQSEILIKVKEPRFNEELSQYETEMLNEGSILIAFLHPAAPHNLKMIKALQKHNITSFTLDSIPRIPEALKMDALTSMSMISGYKSFLLATEQLPRFVPEIATPLGVINKAKVLVVGAGVVGLQAIKTAKGLGAEVLVIDISKEAKEAAEKLGAKIVGLDLSEDFSSGQANATKYLPIDLLNKERELIAEIIKDIDIVILGTLVFGQRAPILITEDMLGMMKKGAVISDIAIDQGGNCEVTEPGKIIVKNDVKIIGVLNIPGTMPQHATWLYANNMYQFLLHFLQKGGKDFDPEDEILKTSIVTHKGEILHPGVVQTLRV
jgi:NAD(P) transhydrogenase subunit alpha